MCAFKMTDVLKMADAWYPGDFNRCAMSNVASILQIFPCCLSHGYPVLKIINYPKYIEHLRYVFF